MCFSEHGVQIGRIRSLMAALPLESETVRAVTDQPASAWNRTDMLLAHVLESLDSGHRIWLKVYGKKGQPDPPPLRIEYPGRREATKPRRRPSSPQEIAAFLGRGRVRVIDGGKLDGP